MMLPARGGKLPHPCRCPTYGKSNQTIDLFGVQTGVLFRFAAKLTETAQ
jgi:hypothetical protein